MAKKHGMRDTKVYNIWSGMINRARPDSTFSERYKKLVVSESWKTFINFFNDMGHPPEGMTLDRIDNLAGYSKENCRWASPKEQARNRSNSKIFYDEGAKKLVPDYAAETGMQESVIYQRLSNGMSIEDATNPDLCKVELKGEYKYLCEWLSLYDTSSNSYHKRVARGWSVERAITTPSKRAAKK